MANFEVFCWNFSSSTNPEIGKSDTSTTRRKKNTPQIILILTFTTSSLMPERASWYLWKHNFYIWEVETTGAKKKWPKVYKPFKNFFTFLSSICFSFSSKWKGPKPKWRLNCLFFYAAACIFTQQTLFIWKDLAI